MKSSSVLGLNARALDYIRPYNLKRARSIAASKLRTKRILAKAGVAVPELYKVFRRPEQVMEFNWEKLPAAFALKPNLGLGGEGIIVVKKKDKEGRGWITTQRELVTIEDLRLHALDILEGVYNYHNRPDTAYIEEYVGRHKMFRKFAYRGTPDIRVIVFNRVPMMAMLRLPTRESRGKANLVQGAIGVGIDIATGITTYANWHGEFIRYKPGTKKKLNGLKIPRWTSILRTAVAAQEATEIGFLGADVVLHPDKGPMVLELNAKPGVKIQLCNRAGLRRRLSRVEGLAVQDGEHGVKIGKALFAASFADRVKAEEGVKTISAMEEIKIRAAGKRKVEVTAKIDTGAWRTSISEKLARELDLLSPDNVLWTKTVKSSLGREERPVINLTFWLAGRKIVTPASVAKRMALKFPVIIGRKNLKGFVVNPHIVAKSKIPKGKTEV